MENHNELVECPYCRAWNSKDTIECSCGYYFNEADYRTAVVKTEKEATPVSEKKEDNSFFAPEKAVVKNNPLGGGLLLMIIAVVWFVVGYESGLIFFYPPVLFLFGLIAFLRGIFKGESEEVIK